VVKIHVLKMSGNTRLAL